MVYLKHKVKLLASTALVVMTLAASPAAVSALQTTEGGSGSGSVNNNVRHNDNQAVSTSSTSTSESTAADSSSSDSSTATTSTTTASSSNSGDNLHDRVEQLLAQRRQNIKQRTTAQRQQACTNHQSDLDTRMSVLGDKAGKFLNTYNAIFNKIQAYQAKKQLTVANYDSLVADTTAKQAAATTAVNTLAGLSGTKIDCTATDPASTVASVKTAADDAKTALQAYRSSLKALVDAMVQAGTAKASNGGNQ